MLADLRDVIHAFWWKTRRLSLWRRIGLGKGVSSLMQDPESCAAMFNWVILRVIERAPNHLPADILVTSANVSEYSGPRPGEAAASRTQSDPAEAWRKLNKHARHRFSGSLIVSCGRTYTIVVHVHAVGKDQIHFRIEQGEQICHPEHVEAKLGIEDGKAVILTAKQLEELVGSRMAYGHHAPGANTDI